MLTNVIILFDTFIGHDPCNPIWWFFILLVFLPEALHSTYKVKALKKLKEKLVSELQPLRQTLQSISVLQLDENPKVAQTAISFLRSASANNVFRTKVRIIVLILWINKLKNLFYVLSIFLWMLLH